MRIAVIGCGSIGLRHLRNLKTLGYSPRGWDIDPSKGDPIDWAWKPDLVLVCTPPDSHIVYGIKALASGAKGVFIEKPLSHALGELEAELLDMAATYSPNTITMVGCNWRFRKGILLPHIRAWSHAYFRAHIPMYSRFGVTLEVAIHLIDLALWLRGPARWNKSITDGITLHSGEWIPSQAIKRDEHGIDVSCFARGLWAADHRYSLIDAKFGAPYLVDISCTHGGMSTERRAWHTPNRCNQMYLDEMRHFLRCVKTGEPTGNDFAQAAETLKLVLEVRDGSDN